MANFPEVPAKAKKFQYKTKYNTTWFSQENLKNYKESFIFTVKYAPKMYHVAMVLQMILWDIVTQLLTKKGKKKDAQFFILKIT